MNRDDILYVIGSLDIGGTEQHLAQLAPRLKQAGWNPSIYCITRRGALAHDLEHRGVPVLTAPWLLERGQTKAGRFLRLSAACVKLFWHLLTRRPAIAHFFLPLAYLIGAPLALLARTPALVMSRRSLNYYQVQHPFLRRIEITLHRRMNIVLGNSQAVVNQLIDEEFCDPGKVRTIYNGVDIETIDRAGAGDRVCAPISGELILIIVANLIPYKGHALLIEALADIKQRLPKRWTLWCVGRNDGIRATLEGLVHRLDLSGNVQFLGERTDVAALLKQAHIGILCSHEEGFSNAILEGMAAGLPMVVTNVGGNAEAVLDGQTGLVVPPRNADALGQAILRLAHDPNMRARMRRLARERIARHFSMDECVRQYADLYRQLTVPRSSQPEITRSN